MENARPKAVSEQEKEEGKKMSLSQKTIRQLAFLIQNREISPVELVKDCLRQIAETEPEINAFITVLTKEALLGAEEAEKEIMQGRYRGFLHGIPYSAKDLYMTRGIRTTGGSAVLSEHIPTENAAVVERLEAAGAILVGKNNLHEFAYGTTNENDHFGPCRNPWDRRMIPGGSSGGSAASVAAASSVFSMGTDTGGSIRIPASFCGIVGLKPTYGRVSKRGVLPLGWSMDHAGPLARTVWDAAAVLEAVAGYDAEDASCADVPSEGYVAALSDVGEKTIRGLNVGVCPQYYAEMLHPEVERAFVDTVHWFEEQGAVIKELTHPSREAFNVGSILTMAEAYTYHEQNLEKKPKQYGASVRYRLEKGQFVSASAYINAQRLRQKDRQIWAEIYREIDVFLSPTVIMPAFSIGEASVPFGAEYVNPRVHPVLMYLTSLGNFNGHPVVSLPCGFTGGGLPIGFQIQGAPFDERNLLRIADVFERAHPQLAERKCDLWT